MRGVVLAAILAASGCGRLAFDELRVTGDGGIGSDSGGGVGDSGDAFALTWSHLVAYANQTCAIHNGAAYCWGVVPDETSGAGASIIVGTPHIYPSTSAVTAVAPGEGFVCEVESGQFECFGSVPGALATSSAGSPVTAMSAGRGFACFVGVNGVYCWGANDVGQLGLGDINTRNAPTLLSLSPSYTQIRAGDDHACAFSGTAGAVCWGHNDNGTIGTGSMSPASLLTPQSVSGITSLPMIAGWHACALVGGNVLCWGRDTEGELGDGGSTSNATPTQIATGATLLASGGGPTDFDASCAVIAGTLECWGDGTYGRLGQGMANGSAVPVAVVGLPSTPLEVAIGYDHTCAHFPDDTIWCWGRGDAGQLGDGLMTNSLAPVRVALP